MRRLLPLCLGAVLLAGMPTHADSARVPALVGAAAKGNSPGRAIGFVTGGGWIDGVGGRPMEKVTFGFNARLLDDELTVTGETQVQVHELGIDFHSTSHDSLFLLDPGMACWQGWGTINREGRYRFAIVAVDGKLDGTGIDKIWFSIRDRFGNVLYDTRPPIIPAAFGENPMGVSSLTPLEGGSIVLHGFDGAPAIGMVSQVRRPVLVPPRHAAV